MLHYKKGCAIYDRAITTMKKVEAGPKAVDLSESDPSGEPPDEPLELLYPGGAEDPEDDAGDDPGGEPDPEP